MPEPPTPTAAKNAGHAARQERLAAALRANLRRRKEQARARGGDAGAPDRQAADAAGQPPHPDDPAG
jgi:hypothetical protein